MHSFAIDWSSDFSLATCPMQSEEGRIRIWLMMIYSLTDWHCVNVTAFYFRVPYPWRARPLCDESFLRSSCERSVGMYSLYAFTHRTQVDGSSERLSNSAISMPAESKMSHWKHWCCFEPLRLRCYVFFDRVIGVSCGCVRYSSRTTEIRSLCRRASHRATIRRRMRKTTKPSNWNSQQNRRRTKKQCVLRHL